MSIIFIVFGWALGIATYGFLYNLVGDDYGYRNRD